MRVTDRLNFTSHKSWLLIATVGRKYERSSDVNRKPVHYAGSSLISRGKARRDSQPVGVTGKGKTA